MRKKARENAPGRQCWRGLRPSPIQTSPRARVRWPSTTSGASARAWCATDARKYAQQGCAMQNGINVK